ncbi:MAG TPA: ATP-binding protein [Candidatus Polarisedimenticolia bacterium]|nr:ATP-binding protein [Candidatus Polarisedimenticolia bacterium]
MTASAVEPPERRSPFRRHAFGLAAVAMALAFRLLLDPILDDMMSLTPFYIAVALTAWFAGTEAAILAALLGFVAGDFFFVRERGQLSVLSEPLPWSLSLLMFATVCASFIGAIHSRNRAVGRARREAGEAERRQQELERQMTERWKVEEALRISEERLALAVKAAPLAVFLCDHALRCTWAADPGETLLGPDPVGQPLEKLLQRDGPELLRVVREALSASGAVKAEAGAGPEGERRWYDVTVSPLADATGAAAGLVVAAFDVTERRRAAEQSERLLKAAWRAEEEAASARRDAAFLSRAAALLSSSLDYGETLGHLARLAVPRLADCCVIDVLEEDGRIDRVAAAHTDPGRDALVQRLKGFAAQPGSGHPVARALASGTVSQFEGAEVEAAHARSPEALEIVRQLGLRRQLVVPLHARGRLQGAISFMSSRPGSPDDHEDRELAEAFSQRAAIALDNARLYQQARAALEQAGAASRAKDDFLATLSHELRSPLQGMLGWVRLLESGRLPAERERAALAALARGIRAQEQLVNDMLDVSRIVTGKLRLEPRPADLAVIVWEVIEEARSQAEARRARLDWSCSEPLPIVGDHERLRQVVRNLLSNALKFTPEGGRITVDCSRRGEEALLQVTDTGRGIDPAFLPRVFERYSQQEKGGAGGSGEGLGLGLSIVRHFVEAHGGKVEAHSEGADKGASFCVRIPLVPGREPAGRPSAPPSPAPPSSEVRHLEGVSILLVEDHPAVREALAFILESSGARVRAAGSVAEAVAAFERGAPDVVVTDLSMPREDGFELVKRIREMESHLPGSTPALALTAYAGEEHRRRSLEAGFQDHVVKPADPDELVAKVADLVEKRGRRRAGSEPSV